MTRWFIIVGLLVAACGVPHSAGGPVAPSPPGPVDLIRGLWGDYGGRCPSDYRYCKGGGQSVCCPIDSGCYEDAGGAYCAPRSATAGVGRRAREAREPGCASDEIVCSFGGRTTCCPSDLQCCVSEGAPACCRGGSP